MFSDLSWSETAVVALVALIAIGPKELPTVLRSVGGWVRKARAIGHNFMDEIYALGGDAPVETPEEARYILDDAGNPHRFYDLADLRDLKKTPPADPIAADMSPSGDNPRAVS